MKVEEGKCDATLLTSTIHHQYNVKVSESGGRQMEGKCDATLAVYLRYPLYTAPICRSMAAQALPTYISFE